MPLLQRGPLASDDSRQNGSTCNISTPSDLCCRLPRHNSGRLRNAPGSSPAVWLVDFNRLGAACFQKAVLADFADFSCASSLVQFHSVRPMRLRRFRSVKNVKHGEQTLLGTACSSSMILFFFSSAHVKSCLRHACFCVYTQEKFYPKGSRCWESHFSF